MDYNKIVNDIEKYHFLFVQKKKVILLASNNTLASAKEKTLNKIKSKLSSFEDRDIIRLKITKVKDSIYQKSKTAKITSIGGPILITIDFYKVNSNGNLKSDRDEDRNDTLYITEKFLKNNKIKKSHLKKIAKKAFYKQIRKTVLSINTIDKIIKN